MNKDEPGLRPLEVLEQSYLLMLTMPHGAIRARCQSILATMRDTIAFNRGEFAQDVQDRFELQASEGRGSPLTENEALEGSLCK